jgi:hypothetical protein
VKARDAAILEALRIRPRTAIEVLSILPAEDGQHGDQRIAARDSALIRLRVKKLIRQRPDGQWEAA